MITVNTDIPEFLDHWDEWRRQVPYAASKALNAVAAVAREEVQGALPDTFTLRSDRIAKGIQTNRATKRNPVAEVGSLDEFMARQALGGVKKAKGATMAVPQVGRGRPRTTLAAKTPPSKWPGALRAKGGKRKPFLVRSKSGKAALVRRRGKKRLPLVVLYMFADEVKIQARWPLEDQVAKVVGERWAKAAEDAMMEAIETAR